MLVVEREREKKKEINLGKNYIIKLEFVHQFTSSSSSSNI
jgi:hypothetical protein